jgi:hypothetical protein
MCGLQGEEIAMKRLLIVPLVLALVACGGKSNGDEDATDTPTEGTPDVEEDLTTEPTEDPAPPDGEEDAVPDGEEDAAPDGEEDVTLDAEEDAVEDAEEDAGLDVDDDALSECAAALECFKACMPDDSTCISACMSGLSGRTRGLIRAIFGCAERTVAAGRCDSCASGTDTSACWTCLETECSTEISDCTGA